MKRKRVPQRYIALNIIDSERVVLGKTLRTNMLLLSETSLRGSDQTSMTQAM